jgi:hypothetical protein
MLASFRIQTSYDLCQIKGEIFMGKNDVFARAMVKWHESMRSYHEQLLECCLDSIMKAKLERKISYHTMKLRELI